MTPRCGASTTGGVAGIVFAIVGAIGVLVLCGQKQLFTFIKSCSFPYAGEALVNTKLATGWRQVIQIGPGRQTDYRLNRKANSVWLMLESPGPEGGLIVTWRFSLGALVLGHCRLAAFRAHQSHKGSGGGGYLGIL